MVLDDAETIARQARRRAVLRRRRREVLQRVGILSVVLALAAVIMEVPIMTVGITIVGLWVIMGVALHQLRERQQQVRRRRRRASPGAGIGTPRPKGGFSTTRHRSGSPVWINDHAA
ncbi:MAG: hypothetical protein ACR2HR_05550 [Euzebya sp.]